MMRRPEILLSPKADLLRFFLGGAASGNGNWDLGTGTGLGGLRVGVSAVDGSGVDGLGVDGSGIDGFGTDGPGIGSSESGAISLSSLSDGSLPFEIKSSNSTSDTWTKGLVTYYITINIFKHTLTGFWSAVSTAGSAWIPPPCWFFLMCTCSLRNVSGIELCGGASKGRILCEMYALVFRFGNFTGTRTIVVLKKRESFKSKNFHQIDWRKSINSLFLFVIKRNEQINFFLCFSEFLKDLLTKFLLASF